jgi:hypothetical protein
VRHRVPGGVIWRNSKSGDLEPGVLACTTTDARSAARELAMKLVVHAIVVLCVAAQLGCNAAPEGPAMCVPGSSGCEPITCGVIASSFPTFDKTCASATDCAVGVHQINCCGSTVALGMTRAEQARFAAAEQVCVEQYPQCACAQTATAEDGQSVFGKQVVVACQSNRCMTRAE